MDEVEVDFGHTYMVTVFNLPKPENGDNGKGKSIAIPSKLPPDLDEPEKKTFFRLTCHIILVHASQFFKMFGNRNHLKDESCLLLLCGLWTGVAAADH